MRFTQQTIADVSIPAGKPYHIVWDEALPGFGLRVNPTNKVWVVQYRAAGKSRRETIGRVDTISLNDARKRARASIAKAHLGADPQAEKAEERSRAAVTLGAVSVRYLKDAERRLRPRSFEEAERYLKKHWQPLGDLALHKIKRADVAARLNDIAEQNGPYAANRGRAVLSAVFTWAMGEGLADGNPVIGTNKATEEVSRDHVLRDAEVAAIWKACRDDDYGRIVRLLILTGQRRDEVGSMRWEEISLEQAIWSIPRERTKNGLPHDVPLSDAALEILRSAPHRDGRSFVFGDGVGGFQGWSSAKSALDSRIAKTGMRVRPWRLHDLRRTAATRLGELGTLPHVVEAILNHISGHKAGVAGVYNRATYAKEKRSALNAWAEHLLRCVLESDEERKARITA
jgi:integrase